MRLSSAFLAASLGLGSLASGCSETTPAPPVDASAVDAPDVPSFDAPDVPSFDVAADRAIDLGSDQGPGDAPDAGADAGADGGGLAAGQLCGSDGECATGLLCCYPCGIPGCMNRCGSPDPRTGRCPLLP